MLLPEDWVRALVFIHDAFILFWVLGKEGSVLIVCNIYIRDFYFFMLRWIASEASLSIHFLVRLTIRNDKEKACKKDSAIHVLIEE